MHWLWFWVGVVYMVDFIDHIFISVGEKTVIEYDFKRDVLREIHDHEIYMSFVDDYGAMLFDRWWYAEGEKAFQKWANENPEVLEW